MRIRETARLLLFNAAQQILLMKVNDPTVSDPLKPWLKPPFWVTLGGKIEEGEDVISAAHRELFEETGLRDGVVFGPIVWYGEQELHWKEEPTLLKENFVVVRTEAPDITDELRTADERKAIVETRWWTVEEIETSQEMLLPSVMVKLIRAIAVGSYPQGIVSIDLSATPEWLS